MRLIGVLLLAALGFILQKWRALRRRRGQTQRTAQTGCPLPPQAARPDCPQPFGYKTGWLCIRGGSPQAVMEALGLRQPVPCNWEYGLTRAGEGGQAFISPSLGGYVLVVVGVEWSAHGLSHLASQFPDVQYFCTHRVVEYHSWARYTGGRLVRGYTYIGDSGQVTWDEGELTDEELALGGARFPRGGGPVDWERAVPPDEETVLALAAAWGVDPKFEGTPGPATLGWLCQTQT